MPRLLAMYRVARGRRLILVIKGVETKEHSLDSGWGINFQVDDIDLRHLVLLASFGWL